MISIQFSLLLLEAYLEEEMICFWVWKKVREKFQKYWKSQGKVREFLERKKVGTLLPVKAKTTISAIEKN